MFHIRPWEYSLDHEPYKEDLANMINLKTLQRESEQYNTDKARWRAETQARLGQR